MDTLVAVGENSASTLKGRRQEFARIRRVMRPQYHAFLIMPIRAHTSCASVTRVESRKSGRLSGSTKNRPTNIGQFEVGGRSKMEIVLPGIAI
jgi:hypothetical protein